MKKLLLRAEVISSGTKSCRIILQTFFKEIKNASECIVELYKHAGIKITTNNKTFILIGNFRSDLAAYQTRHARG